MIATFGAPQRIARLELSAAHERHGESLEVPGPDAVDVRVHVLVFLRLIAVDLDSHAPLVPGKRTNLRHRRTAHTGNGRQRVLGLLEERLHPRRIVAAQCRINRKCQQALDRESGVNSTQVEQASREKACAGEQQHRERDLTDDKCPTNPRLAAAADDAPGFVFKGRDHGRTCCRQRRTDTEDQCGDDGEDQRKGDNSYVWI